MAIKKVFVVSAETKKAQKEVDDLNKSIEESDEIIKGLNTQLREQERLLENTAKTDIKRRKALNDNIKKTKKFLKEEKQDRSELNKERAKANKELKETVKNQKDLTGVLGFVDKATGGALSAMQNFVSSITSATRGMKLLRVAWIATGIGAFVVAVTSLAAAFTQSEEGQEKLQRGLAVLGAITKQIMDSFADLQTLLRLLRMQ
jgi:DNA repair exonuclease SbcCD ATPase subunit